MPPRAWLIFLFLVGTGFHNVGQAGLELLASSDLPALASHSAGIRGVSHLARPAELYTCQSAPTWSLQFPVILVKVCEEVA